jgi:hypothetical protein
MPPFITISGTIQYQQFVALLENSPFPISALVHFNPLGHYTPQDAAASASYFHNVLNKLDGDPITLLGQSGQLGGSPVIFWVQAQ